MVSKSLGLDDTEVSSMFCDLVMKIYNDHFLAQVAIINMEFLSLTIKSTLSNTTFHFSPNANILYSKLIKFSENSIYNSDSPLVTIHLHRFCKAP